MRSKDTAWVPIWNGIEPTLRNKCNVSNAINCMQCFSTSTDVYLNVN